MSDDVTEIEGGKPDYTPPATQADLDRIIAERLSRAREKHDREVAEKYAGFDDLKAKAEQFDAAEEAAKTELQKAIDRAEAAERAVADRLALDEQAKAEQERQAARQVIVGELAGELKLPVDAIAALRGETREELASSAAALKPLIASPLVIQDQEKTPDTAASEERALARALFSSGD